MTASQENGIVSISKTNFAWFEIYWKMQVYMQHKAELSICLLWKSVIVIIIVLIWRVHIQTHAVALI